MEAIGFLGLGAMGSAIAGRLVDAGYAVTVWNRSTGAADDLVERGARLASSPAESLALPLSFSMLADDAAVDQVLSSEQLGTAPARRIHVCMASVSPNAADALAERMLASDSQLVSAPVLGRPAVAKEGKLNILAAGQSEAIDRVEPLLLHCGVKVWRFGETPRMANAVKISVNFTILHALQAMAESVTLVESQGIEAQRFINLLSGTLLSAPIYSVYGGIIAQQQYDPPGFAMPLGLKDLRLTETLAAEKGITLPTASLLHRIFDTALGDAQLAKLDWAALAEITRQQRLEHVVNDER